ncbi:MAG: hypothetical protein HS127_19610 [Planctomycetia bacterium]|nr:hypothetical protein [Planctomycetia bacterium]
MGAKEIKNFVKSWVQPSPSLQRHWESAFQQVSRWESGISQPDDTQEEQLIALKQIG